MTRYQPTALPQIAIAAPMSQNEKSSDVESSRTTKSATTALDHHESRPRLSFRRAFFWTTITIAGACALCHYCLPRTTLLLSYSSENKDACPQPSKGLFPDQNHSLHTKLLDKYQTDDFLHEAIETLSKAVQIPTESHDDYGDVGEDARWDIFIPFQNYLRQRFPLVHGTMSLTKVNTYGLVYNWGGADTSLKPLLLVAHQDVVPVNPDTIDQWKYPPYSGHYDGELIWGRGSSDDKSGLIGIL
jgi:Gly-Xaa carboxypeptidase